uniref:ATP-dependent DNA helicase n=1 Tax=Tanacetum cinerariifolium TaxID=118510 RepID=A0A6L2JNA3_TANCI|nr:ATP-dependent DNA helicase PIF1-like [Tanacetum cinerariifolium]
MLHPVDEAPMNNKLAYEAFDRTLRDIFTGTFTPASNKHCITLKLTQNIRLRVGCNPDDVEEINEFTGWILNIGEGKIGGRNDGHAEVEFPKEMLIPDSDDHVDVVIKETHDNWEEQLWDLTYF